MNAHVQTPRHTPLGQVAGKVAYRALIVFAIAANIVLGVYAATVILPSIVRIELGGQGWVPPVVSPSPSSSPSPTPSPLSAMGVVMPDDVDCTACHSKPGETNPRPVMAHPLAGWEDCTECHAPNKLVDTAPGHTGIHKDQCLVCHTASADQSPAPKPHHTYNGTTCTACHGNPAIPQAPLPADMADKTNCWVCHGLTSGDELWTSTAAPVPGTNATPAPSAGSTSSSGGGWSGTGSGTQYQLEPTR